MKILLSNMHNYNGGGHVTYIMSLAAGLRQSHDVTIAAPPTSRLYEQASALQGVRVLPQLFTSRLAGVISEVPPLRRFLARERFDIVHVNGSADHRHVMLATLGMSSRPRIIWTKHNTNKVGSFGNAIRARLGTDASIAVCEYVARILRTSPYARHPISTIHLGVDTEAFRPVSDHERIAARQRFFGEQPESMLVFGSVGGTDEEKGWMDLVVATSRLEPALRKRVRIIVAGSPPSDKQSRELEQTGVSDQVLFPGLIADVRPYLAACDVGFVLSYQEAGSYASLETMAMGLPTMVSDVGGLPENVQDGATGWIVPVRDIGKIQACMTEILRGKHNLPGMRQAARERIQQGFSSARQLERTLAVYHSSIGRGHAA